VYEESGGSWSLVGATVNNTVGSSVAISGDGKSILVGGRAADAVSLYEESGGSWAQSGTTVNGPASSSFGGGLAINHNGGRFAAGGSVYSVGYTTYEGIVRTYNSPLNTSVGDVAERLSGEIKVFPNPTKGSFDLQLSELEHGSAVISITDMLGRVLVSQQLDTASNTWNGQFDLPNQGIYTITVNVGGKIGTTRIVVQ